MRQSLARIKTRKEAPADEVARNASLLIRAGFIYKETAGAYAFMPMGLRVLNRINAIIREEMNAIGGQELFLTSLQRPDVWEKSGRWSDEVVDNWFKTKLKSGSDIGLGFTHEEPITRMMTEQISSYRDLPAYLYQIQTKFRNEERAKSGILRGREFLMKDLYSFSRSEEEHNAFYEKAKNAYLNIFRRVGLGDVTFTTFASGGSFSKYSHEFQTLSDAGEDIIYVSENKKIAINKEVYTPEVCTDLMLTQSELVEKKSIEVGNIFSLGTRFSDVFGLNFKDEDGKEKPVIMGSYGIGPSRLMGTIAEVLGEENRIIWPKEVAPFDVHVIALKADGAVFEEAEKIYESLKVAGYEVLFDDRAGSAGAKFADADLIGVPLRIVVSDRQIASRTVELNSLSRNEKREVAIDELLRVVKEYVA